MFREQTQLPSIRFIEFAGQPTDAELGVYLQRERARVTEKAREEVTVMSLTDRWTSTQRRMLKDFELEVSDLTLIRALGLAVVVANRYVRGAITAYYWLAPPDYPMQFVESAPAAYGFVAARLKEAALVVPAKSVFEEIARGPWPAQIAAPGQGFLPMEEEAA